MASASAPGRPGPPRRPAGAARCRTRGGRGRRRARRRRAVPRARPRPAPRSRLPLVQRAGTTKRPTPPTPWAGYRPRAVPIARAEGCRPLARSALARGGADEQGDGLDELRRPAHARRQRAPQPGPPATTIGAGSQARQSAEQRGIAGGGVCDHTKTTAGPVRRTASASAPRGTRAPRSWLGTRRSASAAASACSGRTCCSSSAAVSRIGARLDRMLDGDAVVPASAVDHAHRHQVLDLDAPAVGQRLSPTPTSAGTSSWSQVQTTPRRSIDVGDGARDRARVQRARRPEQAAYGVPSVAAWPSTVPGLPPRASPAARRPRPRVGAAPGRPGGVGGAAPPG